MSIDWKRVAEPQEDGYDAKVTLQYLEQSRYAQHMKQPPSDAVKVWPEGRSVFVNMAASCCKPSNDLTDLPYDAPTVRKGLAMLDLWPAVKRQNQELMIALSPLSLGGSESGHGCTCGNYGDDWGWIYVTADNPWGLAEGIVHETGHWKLRALGVWFENWTDLLLLNDPKDRYVSPVRKDMTRPMGAVLHAQYSYIHVAEMCVRMLAASDKPNSSDYEWTELQLTRIAEGQGTLREHARGTPGVGEPFLDGVDEWTTRVREMGAKAMERRSA